MSHIPGVFTLIAAFHPVLDVDVPDTFQHAQRLLREHTHIHTVRVLNHREQFLFTLGKQDPHAQPAVPQLPDPITTAESLITRLGDLLRRHEERSHGHKLARFNLLTEAQEKLEQYLILRKAEAYDAGRKAQS